MCGIAGIISKDGLSPEEADRVHSMTRMLAHRGPDGEGFYLDSHAALGHRRLAVVDLEGGRQPTSNEDGSIQAVVNGEFYDFASMRSSLQSRGHRLRGSGDSECLPHLYEEHGPSCVDKLNGMFAFCIWDARRRQAVLSRDRLGVKSLYYHLNERRLVFGSELKAVLSAPGVPHEIDLTSLVDYMTYGFIPSPRTIFKNIHKLRPATVLTFADGRVSIRSYWDLHHTGWDESPEDAVAEQLWDALRQATRRRLVCDVPIGAFLSGGLDSTAVVAAMRESMDRPVDAVCCGFDESGFDERRFARAVSAELNATYHETLQTIDADAAPEILCRYFDEPFADASALPTLALCRAARRRVTVALSGDGGDEILAGYRRYRFDQYEEWVRRTIPAGLRGGLFRPMSEMYPRPRWMPRSLRAGATFANLAVNSATGHAQSIATLQPAAAKSLLHRDLRHESGDYDALDHVRALYHRCDAPDHLSKCQYADIFLGLADGILTKVDRASMACGLEVRSPMLDYTFAEAAWRIPPSMRIRRRAGKHLLRRIVSKQVGPEIARRQKHGFEVPLNSYFHGSLGTRFADRMRSRNSILNAWFEPAALERLRSEHATGRANHGPTLWKLVILDAWAQAYLAALPGSTECDHAAAGVVPCTR